MKKHLVIVAAAGLVLTGCEFLNQFAQMRTFAKCKFRLAGVEQVRLAGIRIDGKASVKQLSIMDGVRLAAAVKSGRLPLAMVVNVEAQNPNPETAAMNRLAWILYIDGREMIRNELDRRVEISANGGVAMVPLEAEVDLRQVLSGESGDALLNLAFNVAGEGTHPTHVTLKVKPSILVAGQSVDFPDYVTISTEFGGSGARP